MVNFEARNKEWVVRTAAPLDAKSTFRQEIPREGNLGQRGKKCPRKNKDSARNVNNLFLKCRSVCRVFFINFPRKKLE